MKTLSLNNYYNNLNSVKKIDEIVGESFENSNYEIVERDESSNYLTFFTLVACK